MTDCVHQRIVYRAADRISRLVGKVLTEEARKEGVSMEDMYVAGLLPEFFRLVADALVNSAEMFERRN